MCRYRILLTRCVQPDVRIFRTRWSVNDRVNEGFFFVVTCVVRYRKLSYLSAVTVKVWELERDVFIVGDVDAVFERHLVQSCGRDCVGNLSLDFLLKCPPQPTLSLSVWYWWIKIGKDRLRWTYLIRRNFRADKFSRTFHKTSKFGTNFRAISRKLSFCPRKNFYK